MDPITLAAALATAGTIFAALHQFAPLARELISAMASKEMPGPDKKAAVVAELKKIPELAWAPDSLLNSFVQLIFDWEYRLSEWHDAIKKRNAALTDTTALDALDDQAAKAIEAAQASAATPST